MHHAQCRLGLCYENGEGVSRDMTEAVKYYRLSADQGFAAMLKIFFEDSRSLFVYFGFRHVSNSLLSQIMLS